MVRYWVAVEDSQEALCRMVDEKLADGWQLWGGVSMTLGATGLTYAQALAYVELPVRALDRPTTRVERKEAMLIKTWLLANGASVALCTWIHRALLGITHGQLSVPDGVFPLTEITLTQFRQLCGNPDCEITITGVGVAGKAKLRAMSAKFFQGSVVGHES